MVMVSDFFWSFLIFLLTFAGHNTFEVPYSTVLDCIRVRDWLAQTEHRARTVYTRSIQAGWAYFTNLTEENHRRMVQSDAELKDFIRGSANRARDCLALQGQQKLNDPISQRLLERLDAQRGRGILPVQKLILYSSLQLQITGIYDGATVYEKGAAPPRELRLEPDLSRLMANAKDYSLLCHYWTAWRKAIGPPMRRKYINFAKIENEAARLNNFKDLGEMWRSVYESPNLQDEIERLYEQFRPLYEQMHAYVRRKLNAIYPGYISSDGVIPSHLLGNMWGNSWVNLFEQTVPYPGHRWPNPTVAMQQQNYTVERMVREAERFFTSIGFDPLPASFWQHSVFVRPSSPQAFQLPLMDCAPMAVDFRNGQDFRLKICAEPNANDFIRIHHELTYIYYYTMYKDLPIFFREGANPAFQDAIGAAVALSVRLPEHFASLGLLNTQNDTREADINYLYRNALDRIAFLPFGYLVDRWRWSYFSGNTSNDNMNQAWWNLVTKYQGLGPPLRRSEKDFDPGATFHISQHVPHIQYFISYVMQFQFFKALCDAAGYKGPLIKCDFHGSKQAGENMKAMMRLGASQPWPIALQKITGQLRMDAGPMLDYYKPLYDWLVEENKRTNEYIGWNGAGKPYPADVNAKLQMPVAPAATTDDSSDLTNILPGDLSKQLKLKGALNRTCFSDLDCQQPNMPDALNYFCNYTTCQCKEGYVPWSSFCIIGHVSVTQQQRYQL